MCRERRILQMMRRGDGVEHQHVPTILQQRTIRLSDTLLWLFEHDQLSDHHLPKEDVAIIGHAVALLQQRGSCTYHFVQCPDHIKATNLALVALNNGTYPVRLVWKGKIMDGWNHWQAHADCECTADCRTRLQTSEAYLESTPNIPIWRTAAVTLPALTGLRDLAQLNSVLNLRSHRLRDVHGGKDHAYLPMITQLSRCPSPTLEPTLEPSYDRIIDTMYHGAIDIAQLMPYTGKDYIQ